MPWDLPADKKVDFSTEEELVCPKMIIKKMQPKRRRKNSVSSIHDFIPLPKKEMR